MDNKMHLKFYVLYQLIVVLEKQNWNSFHGLWCYKIWIGNVVFFTIFRVHIYVFLYLFVIEKMLEST